MVVEDLRARGPRVIAQVDYAHLEFDRRIREGFVTLSRDIKDVFARGQDKSPVLVLGNFFHQLNEPLVLVLLELVE